MGIRSAQVQVLVIHEEKSVPDIQVSLLVEDLGVCLDYDLDYDLESFFVLRSEANLGSTCEGVIPSSTIDGVKPA